jgi:hypothetical protein
LLASARKLLQSPSGSGRVLSRQELAEAVNAYLWDSLGRRTNLDATYIGRLERGDFRWPGAEYRQAFRAVLGVSRDADLGFYVARGLRSTDNQRTGQSNMEISQRADDHLLGSPIAQEITDTGGMNRRELLRLLSMAGASLTAPGAGGQPDWDYIGFFADGAKPLDLAAVEEFTTLNTYLWTVFSAAEVKARISPLVNQHLTMLMTSLRRSPSPQLHRQLCVAAADLLQLAGEIAFDANQYSEAAHCYCLAATAAREAAAYDLWACAMTRHAFISVYERDFRSAAPMLDRAAELAGHGDSAMSTRHWVQVVRAQALAGLGDLGGCRQALDAAEDVHELSGTIHNGGWLRFDGSRLAEERGTCYVELRRPDLAEPVLAGALKHPLSARRRGTVLTDLATTAAQRGDTHQLVIYADAALDIARHSGSGVVGSKLRRLRRQLAPFAASSHVRHLDDQINSLPVGSAIH